jgi:multidrug resistance efflux pump
VKIVQRVPVLLEIHASPEGLRAGMIVTVKVDTGKTRGMPAFASWWAARSRTDP